MKITIFFLTITIGMVINPLLYAQQDSGFKNAALVPAFQVNDNGGHSIQDFSTVTADQSGNFIAVWHDQRDEFNYNVDFPFDFSLGGDIYAQRLDSNGNLIGTNIKVNDDIGFLGQYAPAVAAGGNGNFIVAWIDGRENEINEDFYDIYAQRFSEAGSALGSNFKVNSDERDGRIDWSSCSVGADSLGNFVVVWTEAVGDTGSLEIFAQLYFSDGTLRGSNFVVNNFPDSEDNRSPVVTMKASGEFVVAWEGSYLADRHPDIYARRFMADGTPQGNSFIVDDYAVEEAYVIDPHIGMDANGNFLVCWKDDREGTYAAAIYGQWFAASGQKLGNNFKINEITEAVSPYDENISLAVADDGAFAAVWYSDNSGKIKARRFSSDSTAQGPSFALTAEPVYLPPRQPAVAINGNGQFVVTWTDETNYGSFSYDNFYSDIFAQRVENDSTLLNEAVQLNDDSGSGAQINPAISVAANGNAVIAWEDFRNDEADIYLRRFSYEGQAIGEQIRVNDDEYGSRNATPAVAIDSSGQILVVWEDNRGPSPQIFGQFYSSEGIAVDSNFVVLNGPGLGVGFYYKPRVSAMGDGLFIAVWHISNYDIGAQIYSLDNGPLGNAFLVNDISDFMNRDDPTVAVNDSGDFVISWFDRRNNTADIYAQRYDKSGLAMGDNFKVNDEALWGTEPALAFKNDDNLFIVFVSNEITVQRYGPDGNPVGSNFSISDPPPAFTILQKPDIAFDSSGKFIVSWEEMSVVDFTINIFAQRISDAGISIGEKFKVVDSESNRTIQHDVQVWESIILATWVDNQHNGSGWDIFASVLDFDNPGITSLEDKLLKSGEFVLEQNYPNPFNPLTVIRYQLPENSNVDLSVYNVMGQKVRTLVKGRQDGGAHQVDFNAGSLSSGIYFYTLETDKGFRQTKKLVLIK